MSRRFIPKTGFMQGRLSPLVGGKIQAFPWDHWREEFRTAGGCGFRYMEWTLDQDRLYENPLMTAAGRDDIKQLSRDHGLTIPTLTGDCFMQAPFYKADDEARGVLLEDAIAIIESCADLGIGIIVVPLVDNGRIEDDRQKASLFRGLESLVPVMRHGKVKIAFESDFPPARLAAFIRELDPDWFGINYDIGNSAALGFDFREEFVAYADRIINVHVKDRLLGGTTVPLGEGAADLDGCLKHLRSDGYDGCFILQTARAADGRHAEVLCGFRDMVEKILQEA